MATGVRQGATGFVVHAGVVRAATGAILLAASWAIAWSSWEPVSFYSFFPLWLGYILLVDGLTAVRFGTSLLERNRAAFGVMFVVSAPAWWIFELLNIRLANWNYILPRDYPWLVHHALASLAFSTVIPAVFCTSELLRLAVFSGPRRWLRLAPDRSGLVKIVIGGAVALLLTQLFPTVFFPLVWLGLFFIFDPINRLAGRPSIAAQVAERRWDTVLVLSVATLWSGFLWEMWNSRSMPKWTYELPAAEWLRVFEMPILGFSGYIPFALELYALYHLVSAVLPASLVAPLTFDQVQTRGRRETGPRS